MDGQIRRSRCSSRVNIFRKTLQHLCIHLSPSSWDAPTINSATISASSFDCRQTQVRSSERLLATQKPEVATQGNPEATIQACLARQSLPEKHNQEAAESINNLSHRDSQETSSAIHKAQTRARSARPKIVPRGNFTQKICAVRE